MKVYRTYKQAAEIAENLNCKDADGWTYEAVQTKNGYVVEVRNEDNILIAMW